MTNKKSIFTAIICCFMALILFLPLTPKIIYAEEPLTIAKLLSDYCIDSEKNQEKNLTILSDFGDTHGSAIIDDWAMPTYTDITMSDAVTSQDFTSEETFKYGEEHLPLTTIGTDGIEGNKFGLFFLTEVKGVTGIESSAFNIPAKAIYVLTFNVKIAKTTEGIGINAKLIDTADSGKTISMPAIKTVTTEYKTYAFLIRGNEFEDKNIKIQFLWGNVTKKDDGTYTESKEMGYAAVDTLRLFSISNKQYNDLASVTANTKADFFSSNSSYATVANGNFMFADNQNWDIDSHATINDFRPADWTQTTVTTTEKDRVAHYGLIDINPSRFANRINELKIALEDPEFTLINPGNPNTNNPSTHNNVLLLYNKITTYQTVTSSKFTLAKDSYYEFSFKFNTPALKTLQEEETNSLNFYILDSSGKTLYTKENMLSYVEHTGSNNTWTTFRVFFKTIDKEQNLNFIIKLGTVESTQAGYAYVDEVVLSKKTNANMLFDNTESDTYLLKTDEEEQTYLKTGIVGFSDLQNLDSENIVNRGLSTYEFREEATNNGGGDDNKPEDSIVNPNTSNLSYLWYVIPSILLGVCVILGLIIHFAKKVKIKLPKRKRKSSYDRRKTLEKQVAQREKAKQLAIKNNAEEQLKVVQEQIEKLESEYSSKKSNKMALKAYITKRERLQNRELQLRDILDKANNKK